MVRRKSGRKEETVFLESRPDINVSEQQPSVIGYKITAQDVLDKSIGELKTSPATAEEDESKREVKGLLKDFKILTALLLGQQKNKELSKVLDTDKSYTSKQIKELEERGLVKKETEGREVKYEVDRFNVLKFLSSKIVIKTGSESKKEKEVEDGRGEDEKPGAV